MCMTRRRVSHDGSETTARVAAAPLRAPAHRFVVARGQLHGGVLIHFPIVEKKQDPYPLKTRTQLYLEGAKGDKGALKELERREDAEVLKAIADHELSEQKTVVLRYYNRAVVRRTVKTILKSTTDTDVLHETARGRIKVDDLHEDRSTNIRLGAVEELERRNAIFELYLVAKDEDDSKIGQEAEKAYYRAIVRTIISRRMRGEVDAFRAALEDGKIKTGYVPSEVVGSLEVEKLKRAMNEVRIRSEGNEDNRTNALRLAKRVLSEMDESKVLKDMAIGRITPQNSIQFKVAAVQVLAEREDYFELREVVEHGTEQAVRIEADRLSEQILAQNFDQIVVELAQRKGWTNRSNGVRD